MSIETTILRALTTNEEYIRQVSPYLKKDYFSNKAQQTVYMIADNYFKRYNSLASGEVLRIEAEKLRSVNENLFADVISCVDYTTAEVHNSDIKWLLDSTEEFIKERSLHLGLMKAIEIYQGNEKNLTKTAIPDILKDALAVGFDNKEGHDYMEEADNQLEYYHDDVVRIPFDVQILNDITNGGLVRKTLSLLIAGTHVGKTLTMCSVAAGMYMQGYNVLYITLEESEQKIRHRIDANLLNIPMDSLIKVDKPLYKKRIEAIKKRLPGVLKIKEFPTASAGASKFRALLENYKSKHGFEPDVVFIDYLGICLSDRYKNVDNSNSYLKAVTEEIRGLAIEKNFAAVSGGQLNRDGNRSSDPSMTDAADSFASMFVADFVCVLVSTAELIAKNMIMWIQQKNRFRNKNFKERFIVGSDQEKMRLFDVEEGAPPVSSIHIEDDIPVFDKTEAGSKLHKKSDLFEEFVYE